MEWTCRNGDFFGVLEVMHGQSSSDDRVSAVAWTARPMNPRPKV